MNFISSIWEIIWDVLGWFQICTFIDEWEEGVVLRRGKFKRVVGPGIAWHLPLEIDEIHTMNVKPGAMELDEQVLTTLDEYKIVISVNLMWAIFDIKKATIDVEDASDTLKDLAVGDVQELVESTDWDEIRSKAFKKELKRIIQKQAREFGISVRRVKIENLAETKVIRLVH
jgi:regulator of protease activity HflC (stomatin/prohibitin superfamily)